MSESNREGIWEKSGRDGRGRDGLASRQDPPPVDSQVLADARGTRLSEPGNSANPEAENRRKEGEKAKKGHPVRFVVLGLLLVGVIFLLVRFGIPAVDEMMTTVSTDDAFVASYITNVSPRINDNVIAVLVDKDDFVRQGDLLVRLDREPFEISVAQSEAALETAKASLEQTRADVKSQIASVRGNWFQLKASREQGRRQIETLKASVATLRQRQADEKLAEVDFRRLEALVKKGSASQSELDQRIDTLDSAKARVNEAKAMVAEARSVLGVDPEVDDPLNIPPELEKRLSTVQTSVSEVGTSLARLGLPFEIIDLNPDKTLQQILDLKGDKELEKAFDGLVDKTPQVRQAAAKVRQSERDLDNSRLQLSYTEIRSAITGYVEDRTVNPGNQVASGQTLMSIRPMEGVWVDANFKESQLDAIVIGHPVDLHVDAYPHRIFRGRVEGFSTATGAAASLLPPENATGNYVKVVQRLPVRIVLVEPNPTDTPLFAGLSVVPHVRFQEKPTGPHAGERLRGVTAANAPGRGGGKIRADTLEPKPWEKGAERRRP